MTDRINPIALLQDKKDDETVWVENMLSGRSVFRGKDDNKYEMEAHGMSGSLVSIPAKVLRGHTYLIRKVSEGKIKLLSDDEARNRQDELVEAEFGTVEANPLKYMEEGSQEANRYAKDLPDDGETGRAVSAREIWGGEQKPSQPKTVRRSGGEPLSADEAVVLDNVVVETEAVKEGEWTPDTGV